MRDEPVDGHALCVNWSAMETTHDHQWTFAILNDGWAAACACGVGAVITERPGGQQQWRWRKDGVAIPSERCAGAAYSMRAQLHEVLFDSERPSKN